MAQEYTYCGDELDLFAAAVHWKAYFARRIAPYLGPEVLEAGAGFGGTTRVLAKQPHERWLCLEPDAALAERLAGEIQNRKLPSYCQSMTGTLDDLPAADRFDSILYIDVLEHIEDDNAEMRRAARRLKPGGHLVILCPAHQWLYSPFDKQIGHFRRYNRRMFHALDRPGMALERIEYLDSVGLLASTANRLLLRQSIPTPKQIAAWDRLMVPVSTWLDWITRYRIGKSILGIWRRETSPE